MDFRLDPDVRAMREAVVDFARADLNRSPAEHDRLEQLDRQGWSACGRFGLLGLTVPADFGGQGKRPAVAMAAIEGLAYACRDNGLVFAVCNHLCACVAPIARFGTARQKADYLPRLASGASIGAHAMSEAAAGSDTSRIETTATRRGEAYTLRGRKRFITNGPVADLFVVFARTARNGDSRDLSAFLVPRDAAGVRVGPAASKMGLRSAPMADLVLDDCVVAERDRLGREGEGTLVFAAAVETERCYLSAAHLGAMKRQLDACVAHAVRRRQFDRPIAQFQAVAHALVAVKADIELGELLLQKIAWLLETRRGAYFESALAKLFTSESYIKASLTALQAFGAAGYMASDVERQARDSLASTIYAGTSEVQREILASWIGLDRRADAAPGGTAAITDGLTETEDDDARAQTI